MPTPSFSIVIGFRNREIGRVSNCLQSLAEQRITDFELIFVDYGSEQEVSLQIKKLVESFGFAKYIYTDTRGMFWNRAHAINTGINLASGDLVLISDIDLVLPHDFITNLLSLSFDKVFYTFRCYYLDEDTNIKAITGADLARSVVGYVGLCAVSRNNIVEISGLDEYYMHWGGEDDDLYTRLQKLGCVWKQSDINEFPVLHQWHPKQSPKSPSPWYLDMVSRLYAENVTDTSMPPNNFGRLVKSSDRSILQLKDQHHALKKLELFPNPLFQFNLFLESFYRMKSGECGILSYPIPPVLPKGRKQKVIDFINKYLSKVNFPYSIQKSNVNLPVHAKDVWDDFIMYFIGRNRSLLSDYYITNTNKEQSIAFLKK